MSGRPADERGLGAQVGHLVSCANTLRILAALAEREASPKELAEEFGISVPNASHHAKKLVRLGLVELTDERVVGGVIQHFYRAVTPRIVSTKEWERFSLDEREPFSSWIVQLVLADATISIEKHLFDQRAERHLSRVPLKVDPLGFGEAVEIQNRALMELLELEDVVSKRQEEGNDPPIYIVAAMMCFETTGPRYPLAKAEAIKQLGLRQTFDKRD